MASAHHAGDDPEDLVKDLQGVSEADLIGGDAFEKRVAKVVAFVERPATGLDLPLDIQGTAFQQRVWQKLCEIPFGKTRSYSEIAETIGQPKSTRAVAQACGANPSPSRSPAIGSCGPTALCPAIAGVSSARRLVAGAERKRN